ncbi:vacuolar protein sorting-associated protein vta1 like protein [Colletotrichum sojae]|uniref:Vacuolar protein sorting-associated protein vta1 like protein n=1 Tax=Colletotrichum sojae TaxID=2175907 RepID=A0A8H6JAC2_9PEZI|nr:vacuolar protein sorting-associated protein vta1 like protein [Colletotrichum sojae]
MADPIPESMRQADITRFINRANQLRKHKPAITYWCEYWVINQILAKQLHNVDEESLAYTTNLMDRLERVSRQIKTENANDEAITDDTVGQAYVEQFAQEAFDRAEKVMRANRVTRQTADTFDAAATFLLLGNIWGQIDEETQKKVKYAKWNAARILKAIKEGRDPNESNPKQEPEPEEALPALDPDDPDVRGLTSPPPKATFVEDDPETEFYKSAAPPAASSPPPAPLPSEPEAGQSSVLDLPSVPTSNDVNIPPPQNQGYFDPPEQFPPSPLSQTGAIDTTGAGAAPSAPSPYAASSTGPSFSPANATSPWQAPQMPPSNVTKSPPPPPQQFKPPPSIPQQPKAPVAPISNNSWKPDNNGSTDDLDLPKAQKHAKWAISALNFEDVPTAIKELRNALAALGAQ